MPDAGSGENSWNELLKASRAWQLQTDVPQLITHIARTAHELLAFDRAAVFLLERAGVTESAGWPEAIGANITLPAARLKIAQGVIQAGRMTFVRKNNPQSSIICTPLTGSREIMGALFLETTNPDRAVTEKQQQFIELFAQQAAACLEHTRLYQSAITDPLTGLFSHRHFQQEVEQAIRRAIRNERPVSLLLIDLDHFKQLNDTCGHSVGNQCLVQVASAMRKTFRATDVLARFGGDEFEMLLPDTSPEQAQKVAENLRNQICEFKFPQDRRVSATIGIAGYPQNAEGAQALFLCADSTLYKAKEAGRNRVLCAAEKMTDRNVTPANRERAALLSGKLANQETSLKAEPHGDAVESSHRSEIIDGHVVVRRLGVGSTGEVLLAVQPGLDREVALKRPLTHILTVDQEKAFEQEARVTASLSHPGIVPIHTIGRDHDTRRYYTMEPLSGLTLEQILDGRRKGNMEALHAFTPGRLLEILQRVSEAIAFAHDRGVLHRDIRPSNIIVGKFGEVTVIDWATGSSSADRATGKSEFKLVGSPAFLAPELLRDESSQRSPASDVFALGTLLYLLLTDRLPFQRESVEATLNAVMRGEFTPAEFVDAEAGIDSLLSALCTEALSPHPEKRPTAQNFAQRLGLYIRHESDWTTIRFGENGGRLVESEWRAEVGTWTFKEDHWLFQKNIADGILVWKPPVPGSFRFTCEAWADDPGTELGVVGHRPSIDAKNYRPFTGYFFQFGAELNTVTKFARHEPDALCKPAGAVEPGRHYIIEMEYQDHEGLLHCAVDGKRVFTFRELLPFAGSQIGFYAFGSGAAHFKPLKLERQNWNLQIPALRAADRLYQARHYTEAIACYSEISAAMPGRPAGHEATLKIGLCEAALGHRKEANQYFDRLAGTALESQALAEQAMMEAEANPALSLQLFRNLFDRFPESQARIRIHDAAYVKLRQCATGSRASDINIQIEWNRLGARRINPPSSSQIKRAIRMVELQCALGQWNFALEELQEFMQLLQPPQRSNLFLKNEMAALAIATGNEHLLPDNLQYDSLNLKVMPHSVRIEKLAASYRAGNSTELSRTMRCLLDRKIEEAVDIVERWTAGSSREGAWRVWEPLCVLFAHAGNLDALKRIVSAYELKENFRAVFEGLLLLGRGDFENAAGLMRGLTVDLTDTWRVPLLWKVLLKSLGYFQNVPIDELGAELDQILCGPELQLAEMFLERREPRPTELWPHPLWAPDRRLWLALWLEAKGRKSEAIEVITPARDPRFGMTQCQPPIEALLKRLK